MTQQEEMEEKIEVAKTILERKEYDQLKNFFMKVLKSESDFIVFGTKRCSLLYRIFLPIALSEIPNLNRCITSNALLLYATEFAKSYKESGKFPNIIVVEDLRFFGTNTESFLHKFLQLIMEEINKIQKLSFDAKHTLQHALRNAVKIYAYATFDFEKECDLFFSKCIILETQRHPRQLNELLKKISELIKKSNEANTNFHFSIKVPESLVLKDENEDNWSAVNWHYRGKKEVIYFNSNVNEEKFISTVLLHGFESYCRNGRICLTGIPVWTQFTKIEFDECCNIIKSVLEATSLSSKFRWIHRLLDLKHDNVLDVKAQFVSFIFSVLSVYTFYKDCGTNFNKQHLLNNSNAKCIAMNFGRFDDVWTDIEELCTNENLLGDLQVALDNAFGEIPQTMFNANSRNFHEDEIKEINKVVEEIFYQAKLLKDVDDYEFSCKRKIFYPNVRGSDVVLASELLSKISSYQISRRMTTDYLAVFACQVAMLDNGLTIMSFEHNKATGKVECAFKADELSTFVLPLRLHWFIPALAHVEKERYGIATKTDKLLKEFIEYILNSDNNPENEMECEALKCLKEQGNEFVDMLYKCDQRVRFWEFNLFSYDDFKEQRRDDEGISYLSFLMHNSARERYYVSKAKSFIEKKRSQRYG